MEWINAFVAKEDDRLGRQGGVCPCMTKILSDNLMYIVVLEDIKSVLEIQLTQIIMLYSEKFQDIYDIDHNSQDGICLAILLADKIDDSLIISVHKKLKPWFIKRGMMLGEFYPSSNKTSIRTNELNPLRSPIQAFVIRKLSKHDIYFIEKDTNYSPEETKQMIQLYRQNESYG